MNRWLSIVGVAAMTGLYPTASGCTPSTAQVRRESGESGAAKPLDRVTAAAAQRKTLHLVTSQPGRVEAFEETPLFPKLAGYVQEVLVDIGDAVSKDQTLLRLWIPELQDELKQMEALVMQAEAEVRQAEAAVAAASAAVETAEAEIQQAEASIARTDSDFQRWKSEHARIEELAAKGSVTKKLADESLNQLQAAEAAQKETAAKVATSKAAAAEARANVQKAEADRETADTRVSVAKANLARTTTLAAYATIKAPFDGVVTHRHVDTGHFVQPANGAGVKPLVVVVRTDMVRICVDLPELEAPLVDSGEGGDAAVVQVQALGSREFKATVTRTGWALDSSNRSLRTEIDIPNADGLLRPGMYATATIQLEERLDALALPITAIIREGGDTFCCRVESGEIVRQPIRLGLRFGEEVEVLSGLDAGNTVVLARAESLIPGQAVEVLAPEVK